MIVGPYDVSPEFLSGAALITLDSWRVHLLGLPRAPGETPAEIAAGVLRRNAGAVLRSGEGHFHYLWPSDFGKALAGAWGSLGEEYLAGQIDLMTRASGRLGRVASCFTATHGFDMPWRRGDNLPWLIYSHAELARRAGRGPDTDSQATLQRLLDRYEADSMKDGLISPAVTGDWVDTIRRPSSTYNNLCALMMFRRAPELGLRSKTDPSIFASRILEDRWRKNFFRDHAGTEALSVDAAVLSLYLNLFGREILEAAADRLAAEKLDEPWPMRAAAQPYDPRVVPWLTRLAPGYHRAHWLHLGLMWLNGLKRLGRDVSAGRAAVEFLILRHGQVVEAVEADGRPYLSPFISCERGLTMAAGQYLELVGR